MGRKRRRRGGKRNLQPAGGGPSLITPTPISSSSPPPSSVMLGGAYNRSICLCTTRTDLKKRVIERWYHLNISSKQDHEDDHEKDDHERENRFIRDETNFLAFNHDERHDRKVMPILHPNKKLNSLPTRPHRITNWPDLHLIAGMGSKLYRIGGSRTTTTTHAFNSQNGFQFHLSRKVYYFDFNNGHRRGWRRAPSMNSGRSSQRGKAIVLNGKLYVFGGRPPNYDDSGHWAEVFDPLYPTTDHNGNGNGNISKFWTPLPPPPPSLLTGYRFAGVLDSSSSIIFMVSIDGVTHAYDVIAKRWERLQGPYFFGREVIDKGGNYGPPLVVDKTVYWISTTCALNAYDTDQKLFFSGPIQDLGIWDHITGIDYEWTDRVIPTTYLFHLIGELFCLIWLELETWKSVAEDTNWGYVLHCTKFRVARGPFSERRRHCSLSASVQSCHSYLISQDDQVRFLAAYQFE